MYTLGIAPHLGERGYIDFWGGHDSGAALLKDDEVVAAVEEERFVRIKRADDFFPKHSIRYVLDAADISISDIDVIGIGRDPTRYKYKYTDDPWSLVPKSLGEAYDSFRKIGKLGAAMKDWHVTQVEGMINDLFDESVDADFYSISHHRSHAASAHYCSGFDEKITLTVDGAGEYESTVLWDENLNRLKTISPRGNSIGRFYTRGTNYLGYQYGRDAGKVMGLASYGEYRDDFAKHFDEIVDIGDGTYDVMEIEGAEDPVAVFESYFGERSHTTDSYSQRHKDFAYHLQLKTEELLTSLVKYHTSETGVSNLALAGGVAMNCKSNRIIKQMDEVENLFIQPAANDSGICIGAALEAYKQATGTEPDVDFRHVYYGPKYESSEIAATLNETKLDYQKTDVCERAAELLADGKLIGWFQGRMEFGARALGNRSILADPRTASARDNINKHVKHREEWRPFAPSLLNEAREEYLVHGDEAPFMILLDSVAEDKQDEIPAVTHVDGTTRPQTVEKEVNEKYHRLIKEFEKITGIPVLLNTSFNVSGEPIVESPQQALQDFYATGLDALVLGDYIITK
jgi:carbamoyltransferase